MLTCCAELASGNFAVVSEPFANKHHVQAGTPSPLPWASNEVAFRVDRYLLRLRPRSRLHRAGLAPCCAICPTPRPPTWLFISRPVPTLKTRAAIRKDRGTRA